MEVLILGGKSTGLKKRDVLIIKEIVIRPIGGKDFSDEIEIGKLKVVRINEDLVVGKIISGEGEVIDSFKTKPDMLKIVFVKN